MPTLPILPSVLTFLNVFNFANKNHLWASQTKQWQHVIQWPWKSSTNLGSGRRSPVEGQVVYLPLFYRVDDTSKRWLGSLGISANSMGMKKRRKFSRDILMYFIFEIRRDSILRFGGRLKLELDVYFMFEIRIISSLRFGGRSKKWQGASILMMGVPAVYIKHISTFERNLCNSPSFLFQQHHESNMKLSFKITH